MRILTRILSFTRNNSQIISFTQKRFKSSITPEKCSTPHSLGLVLGVYSNENDMLDTGQLTPNATKFNEVCNGRLYELLRIAGPLPKRGECRLLFNIEQNFSTIAVCGLGDKCLGYNEEELIDEGKEAIRIASAVGCQKLQELNTNKIYVESFGNSESAAEGSSMGLWSYEGQRKDRLYTSQMELYTENNFEYDMEGWDVGMHKAEAQNLARQLMETPASIMTPTKFAQNVVNVLCDSGVNVEVKVRAWAEAQKMNAFLAIAKGSAEPPIFLELSYYGTSANEKPIVLIGQGTTFDSGGLSLKPLEELQHMRGSMCGAACVVATCRAIASLKLPVNVRGLIPLCEHMIGANTVRSGDVVTAKNGLSIEIQHTDKEAPLVLVDALLYAENFNPKFILDVGTLHNDMKGALGEAAAGVFTSNDAMWQELEAAAVHTGDRVWRMPIWNYFTGTVKNSCSVDIQNVGQGRGGGSVQSSCNFTRICSA
ncbi:hypothetical protein HA402_014890 [Bradysia odoriphaga]|nr:hypothetical protein HA402_014890 [Bradysia odoriphaga]